MEVHRDSRMLGYDGAARPPGALLDTWVLAVQGQQYFESQRGRLLFGDQTTLARESTAENVRDIERLAAEVLTKEGFDLARQKVQEWAAEHPVDWTGARAASALGFAGARPDSPLKKTVDTVFLPLRSIGGLDQTALAIREVARAAEDINLTAQRIPALSRWSMELVLYQMEGIDTVANVRSNLNSFATSADSLAQTARDLPGRLRQELTTTIADLDERQAGLQATLKEAQNTLAAGDKSLAALQQATANFAQAGAAWEKTIRTLDEFLKGFQTTNAPASTSAPATVEHPFDINEYTRAAESIAKAAMELQSSIGQLQELMGSEHSRTVVDLATARAKSVVTHITLCIIAIVLVVFLAVVGARQLQRRPVGAGK